jgi:PAS domain S-box-containing protein
MKEVGRRADHSEHSLQDPKVDSEDCPSFSMTSAENQPAEATKSNHYSPEAAQLSRGSASLDLTQLLSSDVTESGSFDLSGMIWNTSLGKILQAVPLITFLVDENCRIVAANEACQKLGSDYSRIIGIPFANLFPDPSEAARAEEVVKQVFLTREQCFFKASLGISPNKTWGRMTFRSIRLGTERLVLILVEDLTVEQKYNHELTTEINRRRLIEKNLVASEEQYRLVVESANDAIYTTDRRGQFTYLNPVALKQTQYSKEELLGQHYSVLIHPGHVEAVLKYYALQFSDRTPQTYYEFQILAKDGTAIWIGQNVQLLMKDDKVTGFQAIARDITDRKLAEEKLRASLVEKEVLMREIHHRVKNNLQVISALLTLQADHVEEQKAIEVLSSANARLKAMALVHEKLYESNNLSQIRIDEYVADLVSDLISFDDEFGSRIDLKIDIDEIYFEPDTMIPIGLIITELLTNAMKHAFPEGRHGMLLVRLRSIATDLFELQVSDNGIGILEEMHSGHSPSLGLELVTAFAKKLQGEVHFNTSAGTQFSMKFKQAEIQRRSS